MSTQDWDEDTRRAIAQSLTAFRSIDPSIFSGVNVAAKSAASTWAKAGADIKNALSALSQNFITLQSAWKSTFSALDGVFADLSEQSRKARLIEGTGWLPHRTTPWAMICDDECSLALLDEKISYYYSNNWDEVKSDFLSNLQNYDVDQEAKDTFNEALEAHGFGLYRVAPRLLFPELERVGADEFHDGRHFVEAGSRGKIGIASLKDIREAFDDMPAGAFLRFEQSLALIGKLQDHLYEKVESESSVRNIELDPVPNRHASVHGLVAYRTQKTSLNAIIMTDFMFHLMDRLKFYVRVDGDEAAT